MANSRQWRSRVPRDSADATVSVSFPSMTALLGRLTLGIQARLVILILATVLPLVGLASATILRTVDDEQARIQRDVKERAENLLGDVDRQIASIQGELQVLAVSPSLQTGNFVAFDRHMREALKIRGTSIALHDTKAQQLLSTTRPFGDPLPYETNSEMLDRVVETGQPQISDLIIGAVLARPILTVGVPVRRDGRVAYVLAMGLGPERETCVMDSFHPSFASMTSRLCAAFGSADLRTLQGGLRCRRRWSMGGKGRHVAGEQRSNNTDRIGRFRLAKSE